MDSPAEKVEAAKAFDEAKASNDEAIPLVQAISEIEDESNDND